MEPANQLILVASGLILISIFAGTISSRVGAPLLLVFLILGMLAGEDGPGGIDFDDFEATYTIGSVALAVILFDGGQRTRWPELRAIFGPAALLATFGVLATAAITGAAARLVLDITWLEGMLIGSIVASTDAAAVFLLLHLRGMRLRDRLRSALEAEAGLNDPMAVLLTITCVSLLMIPDATLNADTATVVAGQFTIQIAGGCLIGVIGGYVLLFLINRLNVATGIYPVVAAAGALVLFSAAQELGASGFLAAYLAGAVVGNHRHKATMLIDRFMDGLAWLCQISMFLILGLLVTPSSLGGTLIPALLIAFVLIFVARPLAVAVILPWFGFNLRETGFVSWVGLRGAVPIFLGTIPVLSGIANADSYFGVVYVVVMISLLVQGWTVGVAGRMLGVLLPPRPETPPRIGIDLPSNIGRDMTAYSVQPGSLALRRPLARLPFPEDVDLVSIIRDGKLHAPTEIADLSASDDVLLMAPAERLQFLDRLFGTRPNRNELTETDILGEFSFDGEVPTGAIAEAYGFNVPAADRHLPVGQFLADHLSGRPAVGRRLHLGVVELIVGKMSDHAVTRIHIELDPPRSRSRYMDPVRIWTRSAFRKPLAAMGRAKSAILKKLKGG